MGEVVSLLDIRRARAERERAIAPPTPQETQSLQEKILALAPPRVSKGAVLLLLRISQHARDGRADLSYRFLATDTGTSLRSVVRYVEELEDARMIQVRRSRTGKQAAVNQIEIDFSGPLGGDMSVLKRPRSTKNWGVAKNATPPVAQRIGVLPKWQRYKDKEVEEETNSLKGIGRATPQFDSVEQAVAAAKQKTTAKREAKTTKALKAGSQLTLAGVKATWSTVMLRHYPTVPPVMLGGKELAVFKMRMKPILSTSGMSEFFDFVISQWAWLRENKFGWLRAKGKDVALAPSIPELMRYWKVFAQAFADSRMVEANNEERSRVSEADAAKEALHKERAARARADAENAQLREKLRKAERAAYGSRIKTEPEPTLTARRQAADRRYNQDSDIPEWKSDDEG